MAHHMYSAPLVSIPSIALFLVVKGITYVHNGSTDKDLRRICTRHYEHPGSAIGYLLEWCLGHVYLVLELIGSACLMFDSDFVLYELCDLVTECCSESRMRSWT